MNYYNIWADPKEGVNPKEFSLKMRDFLDRLVEMNQMVDYKLTRMKLGFRSMDLPEFHIIMFFSSMQDLDNAMTSILNNDEDINTYHVNFNQLVDISTIQHALYRDYPDE